MKHSKEGAKLVLMNKMIIDELVGNSSDGVFPDFGGAGISDEHSLLVDAQFKKNTHLIEEMHYRRFFSAFWMGGESDCPCPTVAWKCSFSN